MADVYNQKEMVKDVPESPSPSVISLQPGLETDEKAPCPNSPEGPEDSQSFQWGECIGDVCCRVMMECCGRLLVSIICCGA
ncbi:unnamed protein product [Caenorhabditis nigoni]